MATTPFIPDTLKSNPLVNPRPLPFGAVPYDDIKPEHFEPAVQWALAEARKRIQAIVDSNDPPGFQNTIHALAFADEELSRIMSPIGNIKNVASTRDVQKEYSKLVPLMSAFSTEVILNADLFKKIEDVYEQRDYLDLTDEEKVLLYKTYNGFATSGAALTGSDRTKFKHLKSRLAEHSEKYTNNVLNHTDGLSVVVPADQAHRLKGIPEDVIEFYQEKGKNTPNAPEGAYVIPMSPPPMPVLEYADDRSLRQEVTQVRQKIGAVGKFNNTKPFHSILRIRHEIAQLLGFENYADQVIATGARMTDDYREVVDFVTRNAEIYKETAKPFYEELGVLAAKDGVDKLGPADYLYYIRKKKEADINFTDEEAKPYFELESTLKGMFQCAGNIFDIDVKEVKDKYPVAHPDVRTFEVSDRGSENVRAVFYADLFARPGKRSGAWMHDLRNAGLFRDQQAIPMVSNNLNLKKQDTVLLTLDEVRTLFHEFGHGCHGMLGEGTYPSLTGTNTSWDYVELPSQSMECWAFKPDVLATYAFHHKTGAPMPADIVAKLPQADLFDVKWQGLRQSEMALLDLSLHSTKPADVGNLKKFQDKVWEPYKVREAGNAPALCLNFGHLVGGYGAGYYVYKWADALVADVRQSFEEREAKGEGVYPPDLCTAYTKCMIKPGGTKTGAQMLVDFKQAAGKNDLTLDPLAMFRAEGIPVPPEIEARILKQAAPAP